MFWASKKIPLSMIGTKKWIINLGFIYICTLRICEILLYLKARNRFFYYFLCHIICLLNSTQNRDKHGTLTETVIVGESQNTGEPEEWMKEILPRSFPLKKAT